MQAQSTSDRAYDLILIGSGMGALTVASLMAPLRGNRVLVWITTHSPNGKPNPGCSETKIINN
jgi:thioredoxin reductase